MFIGHLPAGYLLGKGLTQHYALSSNKLLFVAMLASVSPDFDLLYFYFIDNRAHEHHTYWFHIPIFWISIYLGVLLLSHFFQQIKTVFIPATVFLLSILLHLFLDTIVGGISWLYPFNTQYYKLVDVPAVHGWWVLNFVLHWTFILELLLVVLALVFLKKNNVHKK